VRRVARRALAGAGALLLLACAAAAAAEPGPWMDRSLSADQRARLLVGALGLEEKVALMHGVGPDVWPEMGTHSGGIPPNARVGFPGVRFTDGPAGITQPGGPATALPAPIALAATWDVALAARYGRLLGAEARALNNDVLFAPMVDVVRHPRSGRLFETLGEDPLLTARMAVAEVAGIQGQGVMATAKHWIANTQENYRMTVDARIDERTLREIYLPPFESAVSKARLAVVMAAYHRVNGAYNAENCPLLRGVLRGVLGFGGYVVSDYDSTHGSAVDVICGTDVELPTGANYRALPDDVAAGRISMAQIDESVVRVLRTLFAFGVFDRPACPAPQRCFDPPLRAHARLARTLAGAGVVLLKNTSRGRGGRLLPLHRPQVRTLAVVGSAADRILAGGGSSYVRPAYQSTPRQALAARAARAGMRVRHAADGAEAISAARAADAAVVVVGDSMTEGYDRPCLKISCLGGFDADPQADRLVRQVAAANPRTIVVLQSGGPDVLAWADAVPAVVEGWYGGQEAGSALAAVLFGDADPSGRLPVSFPRRERDMAVAGQAQYPGENGTASYTEGVLTGYRYHDSARVPPRFAFGHGLSYTTFSQRRLRVRRVPGTRLGAYVTVTVTNTGRRRGVETPQLYVGLPSPSRRVRQPPKWLRGFGKVELAAGQAKRVRFRIDRRALSYWDVRSHGWRVAPGCYAILVGASSRDIRQRATLRVKGGRIAGAC
jgi:beta-glucosidase